MKVIPIYDPEKAEWWCEEVDVRAPNLREFVRLLPPRTEVLGWHPKGWKGTTSDGGQNNPK